MNVTASITPQSISKALRSIDKYAADVQLNVKRSIALGALAVQRDAKVLSPVDTGRNRASIDFEIYDNGYSANVGTNVEYAKRLELYEIYHLHHARGPYQGEPTPFLNPALEKNRQEIFRNIREALKSKVGK